MSRVSKVSHCICIIGIIVFVWLYHTLPGIYYGLIDGSFTIMSPDNSEVYESYYIRFKSETTPTWKWAKPNNFIYAQITLNINDNIEVSINFPSLLCQHGSEEKPFSKALLKELIISDSKATSETITEEQLNYLFSFIISAGDGTLPRTRHHHYYVESPCRGDIAHFSLGYPVHPGLGVIALMAGIILWSVNFAKMNDVRLCGGLRPTRRLVSITVIAVLANYGLFLFGLFLDSFGGTIDAFGASLCETTFLIGTLLIPISILYSFVRRFATKIHQWDFFGVYLSILVYLITILILEFPPC